MVQQLIALLIILYFLAKVVWQKRQAKINANEFVFWLAFWLFAAGAVLGLKQIDAAVARLGFSGSGIQVMLYLGVAIAFYLIFRLRLRLARLEKNLTKLVREISLNNQNDQEKK